MDLDEQVVYVQKGLQKEEDNEIIQTTHPIVIDNTIGYSIVVNGGGIIISQFYMSNTMTRFIKFRYLPNQNFL